VGQCKYQVVKEGLYTGIEMEWRFSIAIDSVNVLTLVAIGNRRSISPTVIPLNLFLTIQPFFTLAPKNSLTLIRTR
jgi:hypothetical protein